MKKIHIPFFRIFYSSTYTALFLLTLVLLAITPTDHIIQTLRDGKIGNIFVAGSVYFVTAILAIFIYASRLYTNRTVLAAIPRSYIPIEDGEISRKVRRVIVANRQRSAMIALSSRPRDRRAEAATRERPQTGKASINSFNSGLTGPPPWGNVAHPGWSAPTSEDLPSLQFETVVAELPNLIEARAVSMAPPDRAFDFMAQYNGEVTAPPDPRSVAMLQRRPSASLRDYLRQLTELGLLQPESGALVEEFLAMYEHARFSTEALTEEEFRKLMEAFATVLSSVEVRDEDRLAQLVAGASSGHASSSNSVRMLDVTKPTMFKRDSVSSLASLQSSQSVIHHNVT